ESKSSFKILTVRKNKLEYLTDPKGLSIAISDVSSYRDVQGTIGTDGYESLPIESGKVGNFYEYKGIYNYLIKIIEIGGNDFMGNSVTFHIEQQGQQSQSAIKRLEEKAKQLQEQREKLQSQINELQSVEEKAKQLQEQREKLQSQINELQSENNDIKEKLEWRDKEIEKLQQENVKKITD
ncbi:hypothetical protein, partial [Nostoc sp. CHAB 5715]|uniref:hypothetical protein n=1 Tax=Nostoc sp. CHAB 5715 TaxID=2780400 RepID=UPI001E310DCA